MFGTKHFIDICNFTKPQLEAIIQTAIKIAQNPKPYSKTMEGKVMAMIFQKPSTRTRVSFDLAMGLLGGRAINLSQQDIHLGKNESLADTAKVLSAMVDVLMVRCYAHDDLLEIAKNSTVPVINGLTDFSHPCQIIASALTMAQQGLDLQKSTLAWVGDGNNVLNSYIHLAKILGFNLRISTPQSLKPSVNFEGYSNITYQPNPQKAVEGCNVIITDTWISMGDAPETTNAKKELLLPFQVNEALVKAAGGPVLFSHCLPAHRDYEVTDSVIDAPYSTVIQEAKNRTPAQAAIIYHLFCQS